MRAVLDHKGNESHVLIRELLRRRDGRRGAAVAVISPAAQRDGGSDITIRIEGVSGLALGGRRSLPEELAASEKEPGRITWLELRRQNGSISIARLNEASERRISVVASEKIGCCEPVELRASASQRPWERFEVVYVEETTSGFRLVMVADN